MNAHPHPPANASAAAPTREAARARREAQR